MSRSFRPLRGTPKSDRADPRKQTQALDSPPSPSGRFCSPSGSPAQRATSFRSRKFPLAPLSREGYSLVESDRPEEILDGAFFLSGEIPRRSFERGMANHLRATSSGEWEPDPLVTDERFMVAHLSGKGLVIFTGCSHAGIVNICRHAQELFPETPLQRGA
jgi:metal-dependent hydrolase (beta-lactamase superfamily II)